MAFRCTPRLDIQGSVGRRSKLARSPTGEALAVGRLASGHRCPITTPIGGDLRASPCEGPTSPVRWAPLPERNPHAASLSGPAPHTREAAGSNPSPPHVPGRSTSVSINSSGWPCIARSREHSQSGLSRSSGWPDATSCAKPTGRRIWPPGRSRALPVTLRCCPIAEACRRVIPFLAAFVGTSEPCATSSRSRTQLAPHASRCVSAGLHSASRGPRCLGPLIPTWPYDRAPRVAVNHRASPTAEQALGHLWREAKATRRPLRAGLPVVRQSGRLWLR